MRYTGALQGGGQGEPLHASYLPAETEGDHWNPSTSAAHVLQGDSTRPQIHLFLLIGNKLLDHLTRACLSGAQQLTAAVALTEDRAASVEHHAAGEGSHTLNVE